MNDYRWSASPFNKTSPWGHVSEYMVQLLYYSPSRIDDNVSYHVWEPANHIPSLSRYLNWGRIENCFNYFIGWVSRFFRFFNLRGISFDRFTFVWIRHRISIYLRPNSNKPKLLSARCWCLRYDLILWLHPAGGQCHLIHLTILRRFSWPRLATMCTKLAIHFIYLVMI